MVLVDPMPDKGLSRMWPQAEQERSGYSFRDLPWIWRGQGTRYWFELLRKDQPSAHLDVRDIFGENYAFRASTVSTVQLRRPMDARAERDTGECRDAEVERLAQGAAGVKRTTEPGRNRCLSPWMFMTLHRSNIQPPTMWRPRVADYHFNWYRWKCPPS